MKFICKSLLCITFIFSLLFCTSCDLMGGVTPRDVKVTTEISEYGNWGMVDVEYMDPWDAQLYHSKIMPTKIEEYFSQIEYVYSVCTWPVISEAYLEFVIEDETLYNDYINGIIKDNATKTFHYDNNFQEYVLNDIFYSYNSSATNSHRERLVEGATIQKVLFSDKERRIIFVSYAHDAYGYVYNTEETFKSTYFKRFNIDIVEYSDWVKNKQS